MKLDAWHPPDPHRSIRVGSVTAVLVTLTVGGYAVAGAQDPLPEPTWGVIAAGVLLGPLLLRSPWIRERRADPWWLLYLWIIANITLLGLFIALVPSPQRWSLLWALVAVTIPLTFPWRGQIVLHGYAVGWLMAATSLSGHSAVDAAVYVALYGTVGYLGGALSAALRAAVHARTADRDDAEVRAELLLAIGRMTSLDTDQVMEEVVAAVDRLGFELANIGLVDGNRLVPVASLGFTEPPGAIGISDGLAGRAIREGCTVSVPDYRGYAERLPGREEVRAAVATPFRVNGQLAGVVTGASRSARPLTDRQVEVIETLAAHVGRSLENAQRFQRERLMVQRLTELDSLKNEFLSNVSHELRTPLTVIAGLGEVLRSRRTELSPDQVEDLLGRLNANSDRLRAMIDSLLDFSRMDGEGIKLALAPVDVAAVARDVVDRMAPLASEHILMRSLGAGADAVADPALLANCIENLLGNAIKHTPPGTDISVSVRRDGRHVEVAVRDDGPGIPADELPLLTDRFYRGSDPGRRPSSGLGLGLALTKQILEAHGSRLDIDSVRGLGTTFSFRLRAVDDRVAAPHVGGGQRPAGASFADGSDGRVLTAASEAGVASPGSELG